MTRVALLLFGVVSPLQALSEPERRNEPSLRPGPNPSVRTAPALSPATFSTSRDRAGATPRESFPRPSKARCGRHCRTSRPSSKPPGLTMEHVVYSQVYLDDMANYDAMDRVWREYFPKAPPARSVLGVYRMPTDIAGRDQRGRVPRSVAQEAHRPGRIPAEPVVDAGRDGRQPALSVRVLRAPTWRRAGCRTIRTPRCNSRSTT